MEGKQCWAGFQSARGGLRVGGFAAGGAYGWVFLVVWVASRRHELGFEWASLVAMA